MSRFVFTLLVLFGLAATGARAADEGSAILTQRCAGCHNLTGPAPKTLKELWARKGPDLFYAGNKYRAEWLRAWLQKPTRIRVAGEFYADHVRSGEKSDEVDTAALEPHLALTAADARSSVGTSAAVKRVTKSTPPLSNRTSRLPRRTPMRSPRR